MSYAPLRQGCFSRDWGTDQILHALRLTEEDREAIHEISKARRAKNDGRTRINDILVDALWELLQKETGKTPLEIAGAMPVPPSRAADKDKLKQMPPPKKKH
jgi:hypothetical protein